jgi:hypothetical protein
MHNHLKTLVIIAAVAVPLFSACGGGGGGGGSDASAATAVAGLTASGASEMSSNVDCGRAVDLPGELQATWNETAQCTALAAAPPKVIFTNTVVCPRNGQPDCLESVPFFECSDGSGQLCGAVGRFLPQCGAIELPDRYYGAAAHEMIHYLLRANGHGDWASHGAGEFVCQ